MTEDPTNVDFNLTEDDSSNSDNVDFDFDHDQGIIVDSEITSIHTSSPDTRISTGINSLSVITEALSSPLDLSITSITTSPNIQQFIGSPIVSEETTETFSTGLVEFSTGNSTLDFSGSFTESIGTKSLATSNTLLDFSKSFTFSDGESTDSTANPSVNSISLTTYEDIKSTSSGDSLDIRTEVNLNSNLRGPSVNAIPNDIRTSINLNDQFRGETVLWSPIDGTRFVPGWVFRDDIDRMPYIEDNKVLFTWNSTELEFIVTRENKEEHFHRLEQNANKMHQTTKMDGSITTVDTTGNNTFDLIPPNALSSIIPTEKYSVCNYSEDISGRNTDQFNIFVDLSPKNTGGNIPEISQSRSTDREWLFRLRKSEIYTSNVEVQSQSRGYNDGLEQFDLSLIITGEQVTAFRETLTNLAALEIVEYDDVVTTAVDYSPFKTNMIYVEPSQENIMDKGLYGVLNWEMKLLNYNTFRMSIELVQLDSGISIRTDGNPLVMDIKDITTSENRKEFINTTTLNGTRDITGI